MRLPFSREPRHSGIGSGIGVGGVAAGRGRNSGSPPEVVVLGPGAHQRTPLRPSLKVPSRGSDVTPLVVDVTAWVSVSRTPTVYESPRTGDTDGATAAGWTPVTVVRSAAVREPSGRFALLEPSSAARLRVIRPPMSPTAAAPRR